MNGVVPINTSRSRHMRLPAMTLALVLVLALVTGFALADSLAIDFEPPTYTIGTIHNQDGWSSSGAAGSGCAVYDHEVVAQSLFSSFGAQSLRISNAVTSGCFGDQTFSKSLTDEAGEMSAVSDGMSGGMRQPYFEAEWDFASTVPGAEQPGLSVVASPDRGDGARMSWVQMADTPGGLEVNFFDYQRALDPTCTAGTGFVSTNLVSNLDRTVPHTIKITMEFVDGPANDIVQVYVDGVLEHTGTSWEDYFRDCENNPTRPVDSILFRTGGAAAPATDGFGFLIDNLALFSGPIRVSGPTCNDLPATIYVNENNRIVGGPDDGKVYKGKLIGTSGDDVILGTDGVDKINSRTGNDTICGEGGNDRLEGAGGNDTIFGGAGADRFEGGGGVDSAPDFNAGEGDTQENIP